MSWARARLLVITGAVGVVIMGTLLTISFAQGRFGAGERLRVANCGPTSPQGSVVNVTLGDRGGGMMGGGNLMMVRLVTSPDSVPSGTVTFVATNVGSLDHEFLILPAPSDGVGTRSVGTNGKIDESSSLGEASTSCGQGAGQGISPGTSSWVTLHLAPGNYELLCDVPWHYANGMFSSFAVR